MKHKWENCMTLDKASWGFRRDAQLSDIYTMEELIALLVETVRWIWTACLLPFPTVSELLQLHSPSCSLHSSRDTRILKLRRFNLGFRSFSYFGPHIWNNLPQDVRHSNSLPSSKTKLETFLFPEHEFSSEYYCPSPQQSCLVFVWAPVCVCMWCVCACVCLYLYNVIQLC